MYTYKRVAIALCVAIILAMVALILVANAGSHGVAQGAQGRILGAKAYQNGDTIHATVDNPGKRFYIQYNFLGGGFQDDMYRPAGFVWPMKTSRIASNGRFFHVFVSDSDNRTWVLSFESPN